MSWPRNAALFRLGAEPLSSSLSRPALLERGF
jgi:hypothetical protein